MLPELLSLAAGSRFSWSLIATQLSSFHATSSALLHKRRVLSATAVPSHSLCHGEPMVPVLCRST